MPEWEMRKLGDLCTKVTVAYVGSMASQYVPAGTPFLRSQNVKPGRIELSSLKYITQGFHDRPSKSKLHAGDLVIVRTGAPGVAAVIPDNLGPANCSDLVIAKPYPGINSRFLCYAINETAQEFVRAHTVGAVQQHFNVASAKKLTLRVPPLSVQSAIVGVLVALDDKIAVNERIAATVDALADAIFAKTARGAELIRMSDLMTPILGGTPDRTIDSYWGCGIPWASAKDVVNSSAGVVMRTEKQITEEAVRNSRAKPMPGRSVVLTARGTVGAVARVVRPTSINQSCYAFISEKMPPATLFHLVRMGSDRMLSVAHGTVFSTVNMKTFDHVKFPNIAKEILPSLEKELGSLHRLIEQRLEESQTLAALRDTLLPQLMSGKLRVRDAERIVEDTV